MRNIISQKSSTELATVFIENKIASTLDFEMITWSYLRPKRQEQI